MTRLQRVLLWSGLMVAAVAACVRPLAAQSVVISGPQPGTTAYRLFVTYKTVGGNIVSTRAVLTSSDSPACRIVPVPGTSYGRYIDVIGASPGTCEITGRVTVSGVTYTSAPWPVTVETRYEVRTGALPAPLPPAPPPAPPPPPPPPPTGTVPATPSAPQVTVTDSVRATVAVVSGVTRYLWRDRKAYGSRDTTMTTTPRWARALGPAGTFSVCLNAGNAVGWSTLGNCASYTVPSGAPPPPPPPLPPPPPSGLVTGYNARVMTVGGVTYRYQLWIPQGYSTTQVWPVVLYLHSSGGRGTDGSLQTSGVFGNWLRGAGASLQAVVVFPQWPMWSEGQFGGPPPWISPIPLAALDSTLRQVRADTTRLYLTGWSLGTMAGWRIAYENPTRFAAALLLSGAVSPVWLFGDTTSTWRPAQDAAAQRLKTLPIWTFVGTADEARLLAEFRSTVQAFTTAGATLTSTEFAGAPHNIEDLVYPDPAVWSWLFAQRRSTSTPTWTVADTLGWRWDVQPRNATVQSGQTIQFCAFVRFPDGTAAMLSADAMRCSSLYQSTYSVTQRTVTAGRQTFLDTWIAP